MNRKQRNVAVLVSLMFMVTSIAAAKDHVFTMPRAFHAKTYPARDTHDNEQVTIAADPYDMPDKAAGVFTVNYQNAGFLPVQVIFSNDGSEPVLLSDLNITLITKNRAKIQPATPDDLYRRISRDKRRITDPGRPSPIPLPRKAPQSISKDAHDEVEGTKFLVKAVEPRSTQAGIFFFDVEGIENPLAGAKLEVTGLSKDNQDLFYFEIPMEKYLSYQPEKP